jgi:hypothetical protein
LVLFDVIESSNTGRPIHSARKIFNLIILEKVDSTVIFFDTENGFFLVVIMILFSSSNIMHLSIARINRCSLNQEGGPISTGWKGTPRERLDRLVGKKQNPSERYSILSGFEAMQ